MRMDVGWKTIFGSVTVLVSIQRVRRAGTSPPTSVSLPSDQTLARRIFAESTLAAVSRTPRCSSDSRLFAYSTTTSWRKASGQIIPLGEAGTRQALRSEELGNVACCHGFGSCHGFRA